MEPILEMRARIRRHMLTAFAGIAAGILTIVVGGGLAHGLLQASLAGPATIVVMMTGVIMIPSIGITSAFRNLRCPACNGLVVRQVNMKYSAFGSFARNECRHCGVTIFAPGGSLRFILLVVAGVLFFAGGILSFMLARPH